MTGKGLIKIYWMKLESYGLSRLHRRRIGERFGKCEVVLKVSCTSVGKRHSRHYAPHVPTAVPFHDMQDIATDNGC